MGVFAALGTALCWAIAARLFRGTGNAFSPLTMNFWKGLISIAILAVVLVVVQPTGLSTHAILWLLLSGLIGIGIGDTCFLKPYKALAIAKRCWSPKPLRLYSLPFLLWRLLANGLPGSSGLALQ